MIDRYMIASKALEAHGFEKEAGALMLAETLPGLALGIGGAVVGSGHYAGEQAYAVSRDAKNERDPDLIAGRATLTELDSENAKLYAQLARLIRRKKQEEALNEGV